MVMGIPGVDVRVFFLHILQAKEERGFGDLVLLARVFIVASFCLYLDALKETI